jgi:serine/threonine-protein kinase HipA
MATEAGIAMSLCQLLEENSRAHFMTRRFDRDVVNGKTIKHHVQTLCAMNHLDYKQRGTHAYSELFMTVAQLGLNDAALQQAFRRMAFNVMTRNYDDHTKNFSFLLRQGQGWELAPAYDMTHAHNPQGKWTYQHLMSVNRKFDGITRADLLAVADRFSVPGAEGLVSDIRAALDNWKAHAKEAGLSGDASEQIARDFLPL